MTYPNAYEGVKKLIAAEAFQIISAGLGIVAALLGTAALAGATESLVTGSEGAAVGALAGGLVALLCGIGIAVLLVLSLIFTLLGLKRASVDETEHFKLAFTMAILSLVAAIAGAFFSTSGTMISGISASVSNALTIAVFVLTVMGISALAKNLGRNDMVSLGNVIIVIETVQLILAAIAKFTGGILALIAGILSFVCYIIYLVYLTKSKNMLES